MSQIHDIVRDRYGEIARTGSLGGCCGPSPAEIATRLTSGGDIAVGFGSVWTSAYDDGVLFRLAI